MGLARFVLEWGLLRFGTVFLICSAVSLPLALFLDQRRMAKFGVPFEVHVVDVIPFVPRLLLICFGGGAVLAVILWFLMESSFRRAHRGEAGA
jgi:hypothetical protein